MSASPGPRPVRPMSARDSPAWPVEASPWISTCVTSPSRRTSSRGAVASGVWFRGPSPVPPTVTMTRRPRERASASARDTSSSPSPTVTTSASTPASASSRRATGPALSSRSPPTMRSETTMTVPVRLFVISSPFPGGQL